MDQINLNIDGAPVKGKMGETILEICQTNGIYLPTLCHLEGLSSQGGCRLCLVDVEGQPRPVPACTTPATDGMKVLTKTEKLNKSRRMILELLLSERNHFCFMCEKSGDCELQSLCYEFGIDHVRFPAFFPAFILDASSEAMAIDNNRCILCGRCVRMCDEIIGNNTLGFVNRGMDTIINEPDLLPLDESNCIQCGACIDVCPTGAIFGKLSSYKGKEEQCDALRTICCECPMACDLTVYVRDNNIVRITGGGLGERFGGQLCKAGRFDLLLQYQDRITQPSIRVSQNKEAGLTEALDAAITRLRSIQDSYGKDSVAGVISPRCTNEAIRSFKDLMTETLGTESIFILEPPVGILTFDETAAQPVIKGQQVSEDKVEDLLDADTVVLIGLGPFEPDPIIASNIRRALNRGGTLVSIGRLDHELSSRVDIDIRPKGKGLRAFLTVLPRLMEVAGLEDEKEIQDALVKIARDCKLKVKDLSSLMSCLGRGRKVIIVAGLDLEPDRELVRSVIASSAPFGGTDKCNLPLIFLRSGGNIRGALNILHATGAKPLPQGLRKLGVRAAYVILSDEGPEKVNELSMLTDLDALVVQASYMSDLSKNADVVIPSPIWSERSGTTTDIDGKVRKFNRVVTPPDGLTNDEEIISEIVKRWEDAGG